MSSYPADWYHRLPAPVKEIFAVLQSHGHISYLVGGAVRDFLLGSEPKDFDLVTNAKPEEIARYFAKTVDIGKHFGIMVVVLEGMNVELASFRKDGQYLDGRHPETIEFASPEEDALRRDFTINGLFWDPGKAEILDFVGGKVDIQNKTIRAIGDASKRFSEDALRMLRALRFYSQLAGHGFTIDPGILAAIAAQKGDLARVSKERITMELNHILQSARPSLAIQAMANLRLDFFPPLAEPQSIDALRGKWREHFFTMPPLGLFWGALLLALPAEECKTWLLKFSLSRDEKERAQKSASVCAALANYSTLNLAEKKEILSAPYAREALCLCFQEIRDHALADYFAWEKSGKLNPVALVSGKDLLALGAIPGKQINLDLQKIRRAQLLEEIHTREEALEFFKRNS